MVTNRIRGQGLGLGFTDRASVRVSPVGCCRKRSTSLSYN